MTSHVKTVTRTLVQQMAEGVAPWMKPWTPGARFLPYNPISGRSYCGMNAVWLAAVAHARNYDEARWLTLRQAEDYGGQVRKGEKGTGVQFWKWREEIPRLGEDGSQLRDGEGRPQKRVVHLERPRLFTAVVFNAEQILGMGRAPPGRLVFTATERRDLAEAMLRNLGASIVHVQGARAAYSAARDQITMPARSNFPTGDAYSAMLMCKLVCASGHATRLNRDQSHPIGSEDHAKEQVKVEIAAMMLGDRLEIGHRGKYNEQYVLKWLYSIKYDPWDIFRAAASAQRIVQFLCGLAPPWARACHAHGQ